MRERRIRISGKAVLELRDAETGELIEKREVENLVVNDGLNDIANLLGGLTGGVAMNYIAVGTDGTAPAATDTALLAELARKASTNTLVGTGQIEFVTTFGTTEANPTPPDELQEAGLFSASAGGTMFNRLTFTGIAKNDTQTLKITITITFS